MAKSSKKIELPLLEDISNASKDRLFCQKCRLYDGCKRPFMPVYIPPKWTGRLLVWCEAPGKDEDQEGRPLVGKAGKLAFELFAEAGISRDDVAIVNSNRCRPTGNATPNTHQIRWCRPFSVFDALSLRPRWILGMGVVAAKSITNLGTAHLKDLRQRCYDASEFMGEEAKGINVTFTYHPASCFYHDGKEAKERIRQDLSWLSSFKGYVQGPVNEEPAKAPFLALDIEWGADHKLLTVGKAVGNKAVATEKEEEWTTSFQELKHSEPVIIGHSVFGDLAHLRINQISLPLKWISGEKARDTVLLSRLKDENLGNYHLENLVTSLCKIAPWKFTSDSKQQNKTKDFSLLPSDVRMERCRLDAWACGKLALSTISGSNTVLVNFSHRLAALLNRVEMAGCKIDERFYSFVHTKLKRELDDRAARLLDLARRYDMDLFEPSNDNHFRDLLFNRIGARSYSNTKTGLESIGSDSLTIIYQDGNEAIKEAIQARLRYEKAEKLFSTYVGNREESIDDSEGLARHITPNWFVFQHINPLGARTGRRSSSRPNMQNWPKKIRRMVISRWPGGWIVKGDYEKLEPRILAYIAGIEEWQELFAKGIPFYEYIAKRMWDVDVVKGDEKYVVTKSTVLGTNYGMEAELFRERMSIDQGLHLTLDEANDILKLYHSTFPALPRFFELQKERLLANGYVTDLCGQVRRLPCPNGERSRGFKHLWNQAVNFPVQGTASKVTGAAMLDCENRLLQEFGVPLEYHYDNLIKHWGLEKLGLDKGPLSHVIMGIGSEIDYPLLINEVHDEIVADSPEPYGDKVYEILKECMECSSTLRTLWPETKQIPLLAEVDKVKSWAG